MSAYLYPVERYSGSPTDLAESLRWLGITERPPTDEVVCSEWNDKVGRVLREVGDVTTYADGRVTTWPYKDATPAERIVLLRTAERVVTHGTGEPGWTLRVTPGGRRYHWCAVSVLVEKPAAAAEASATAAVDHDRRVLA